MPVIRKAGSLLTFPYIVRMSGCSSLNRLRAVASHDGRDGSIEIKQDAVMYSGVLEPGVDVAHELAEGRRVWLHVARGSVKIGETTLTAGDALSTTDAGSLAVTAVDESEVILFDLP